MKNSKIKRNKQLVGEKKGFHPARIISEHKEIITL